MTCEQSNEDYLLDMPHLPRALYPIVDKFFYQAWLKTFRVIHDLLNAGQIPTPEWVAMQPAAIPYIRQGGKVEFVIAGLTDLAKEESAAYGNGEFEETYDDYGKLASCDNDTAFGVVRQKLGLDPSLPWGPYHGMGDDDGMDEYDESDEEFF